VKKIKRIILIITLLLFPIVTLAAGSVTINTTSLSLEHGGSTSFKITANNAAGQVTIKSNNTGIVRVDKSSEWVENQTITVNVRAVSAGTTTITVTVNAATFDEEALTNTYTINVTVKPPKSSNNNLKSLSVNGTTVSGFSASNTNYDLGTTTNSSINIAAVAEDGKSSISGAGNKKLNYGKNTFNVTVTAENGSKKTYTLTITRPDNRSGDNTLSSLSANPLELKFNKNTTSYSFNVENSVKSITINAKANHGKATISGTGTKTLKDYVNTFNIVVTAENGNKKTYTIKVVRKDAEGNLGYVSKDNSLKHLEVEGYTIEFNKDVLEYNIEVDNLVDNIKVNAQVNDNTATYNVEGNTNLKVGTNQVKVNVTAENGSIKTYLINVTRKSDSPTTTLNDLEKVLEKTTSNEIIIEIKKDNTTLNKQVLETIKNSNKNYIINGYSNNKIKYTWSINSSNIGNIDSIETFINFTTDKKEDISKLTNYSDSIYLNFAHEGDLPKDTKIKIYVGDKYQNDSIVNIYYYNEKENKMEPIKLELKVVDGYVEFEIEHCSDYIITRANLNNKTSKSFNWFIPISIIEFLIITTYIIYKNVVYNRRRKKRKTS